MSSSVDAGESWFSISIFWTENFKKRVNIFFNSLFQIFQGIRAIFHYLDLTLHRSVIMLFIVLLWVFIAFFRALDLNLFVLRKSINYL